MLYANNPSIDYALLAAQIEEEYQAARPWPPFLMQFPDDWDAAFGSVQQSLAEAQALLRPPKHALPIFSRIIGWLFRRERLAIESLSLALRQQVEINRRQAEQIAALIDHASRGR